MCCVNSAFWGFYYATRIFFPEFVFGDTFNCPLVVSRFPALNDGLFKCFQLFPAIDFPSSTAEVRILLRAGRGKTSRIHRLFTFWCLSKGAIQTELLRQDEVVFPGVHLKWFQGNTVLKAWSSDSMTTGLTVWALQLRFPV